MVFNIFSRYERLFLNLGDSWRPLRELFSLPLHSFIFSRQDAKIAMKYFFVNTPLRSLRLCEKNSF